MHTADLVNVAATIIIVVLLILAVRRDRAKAELRRQRDAERRAAGPVPMGRPATFTRMYRAPQQAEAMGYFNAEADAIAKEGYAPTAHSWAPGQYTAGQFLVALVLCFVVVGFLVFIYMIIVKPPGLLTVTYVRAHPAGDTLPAQAKPDALRALEQLGALRDSGVITAAEFEAKKAELLSRV
jgi:hypothetical protein